MEQRRIEDHPPNDVGFLVSIIFHCNQTLLSDTTRFVVAIFGVARKAMAAHSDIFVAKRGIIREMLANLEAFLSPVGV